MTQSPQGGIQLMTHSEEQSTLESIKTILHHIITAIAITSPHKLRRWIIKEVAVNRCKYEVYCWLFTLQLKVVIGKQRVCLSAYKGKSSIKR